MSPPKTKMTPLLLTLLLLLAITHPYVESLIVPEELPTILSLIYSNIPPIKKGTDSRVGVGFRLGEHADFQVLFEIGPQQETEPLGNAVDSKKKRAVIMASALKGELGPWAQRIAQHQIEQKLKTMLEKYKVANEEAKKVNEKSTEKKSVSSEWLSKWSNGVINPDEPYDEEQKPAQKVKVNTNRLRVVSGQANSQIDVNSHSDVETLKKLYENNDNNNNNKTRNVD